MPQTQHAAYTAERFSNDRGRFMTVQSITARDDTDAIAAYRAYLATRNATGFEYRLIKTWKEDGRFVNITLTLK